jgi:threonine aldolase
LFVQGLGAPIGSVLLADKVNSSCLIRKIFGGGMRQGGYLAAAGIYALNNNIERLAEDHRRAKGIGRRMSSKAGLPSRTSRN